MHFGDLATVSTTRWIHLNPRSSPGVPWAKIDMRAVPMGQLDSTCGGGGGGGGASVACFGLLIRGLIKSLIEALINLTMLC